MISERRTALISTAKNQQVALSVARGVLERFSNPKKTREPGHKSAMAHPERMRDNAREAYAKNPETYRTITRKRGFDAVQWLTIKAFYGNQSL